MAFQVSRSAIVKNYTLPLVTDKIKSKFIPRCRVELIERATTIEKFYLPIIQSPAIFIKRDDQHDCYASGNKLRKLEFSFGEILSRPDCRHVITAGSLHSNHCKAVAVLAARFQRQAHLLLRTDRTNDDEQLLQGNPLLNYLLGAKFYLMPRKASIKTDLEPRAKQLTENLGGDNFCYTIPVGGSDIVGIFGYIDCFIREILPVIDELNLGHLVVPVSSGGTMEGLALGNYLTGSRLRIHAFAVSDNRNYFKSHFREILQQLEMDHLIKSVDDDSLVDINDKYVGAGYGRITDKQIAFLRLVISESGILFDPTYTGKCLWGLFEEVRHKQIDQYSEKRKNILFLHTGGFLGLMNPEYSPQWLFSNKNRRNIKLKDWMHHESLS